MWQPVQTHGCQCADWRQGAHVPVVWRSQFGNRTAGTSSSLEAVKGRPDLLFTEDTEEVTLHRKNLRSTIEEPICTGDDLDVSREEIKHTIASFNDKKKPAIDGITGGIYLLTFNTFARPITAIYNQYLKRVCFPNRWKIVKIIPITKPGKEKSMDPSKYSPISFLNMGGKVLEELLINRIYHHVYRYNLLTPNFTAMTTAHGTKVHTHIASRLHSSRNAPALTETKQWIICCINATN